MGYVAFLLLDALPHADRIPPTGPSIPSTSYSRSPTPIVPDVDGIMLPQPMTHSHSRSSTLPAKKIVTQTAVRSDSSALRSPDRARSSWRAWSACKIDGKQNANRGFLTQPLPSSAIVRYNRRAPKHTVVMLFVDFWLILFLAHVPLPELVLFRFLWRQLPPLTRCP